MKLSDIIREAVQVVPIQLERAYNDFGVKAGEWVDIVLSLKNWTTFTIAPPVPNVIMKLIFWLGDLLDVIGNSLAAIPGLVAAGVILDSVSLDPKLRHKVLTLDEAVKLVYRVAVDLGIQNQQNTVPRPWMWANTIDRWTKIVNLVERPTWGNLWKLVKKGPWKIIVTLIMYFITFMRQLGVLIMLWNFSKAIEDENARELYFSRALKQTNPRKSEKVRIRRRIGGVPP